MGSGSATGKKFQVRLVHSLLKYFLKFQLWYWIKNLHYQIFKFVIDNSDISLNCLQHIQKRRNFDVTCHQPICLLLHAILSGVGVVQSRLPLHQLPTATPDWSYAFEAPYATVSVQPRRPFQCSNTACKLYTWQHFRGRPSEPLRRPLRLQNAHTNGRKSSFF